VTCQLVSLCFDALDPSRLSSFWSGVLGFEKVDDAEDGFPLIPDDDTGFKIRFRPTRTPKVGQNQMHFDLTSNSLEDQQETVTRALRLGAAHLDIGQGPDAEHVVLADPEGLVH